MADVTAAAYAALTVCAVAVVLLYGRAALRSVRHGLRRGGDLLAVGVTLGFGYAALYYPYWITWRLGGPEVKALLTTNWFIPAWTIVAILAGLSHIRAASLERCGERGWSTVGIVMGAAFIITLYLTWR